jgi:aminoglycoside phosphotransferase (APT) family kinase protein
METELPGTPIGAGRSADVYDVGGGRVLRRYRDGRDADAVQREAEVMAHARAHGVPVPEVFEVTGSDIVMERAMGPTMLNVLGSRPWTVRKQARLLARLHGLVHQVPALPALRAPLGDEGLKDQVLLHLDLHPINVILTSTGPVIIDWESAARGPAMLDVAMTWVVVGFSEVPESGLGAAAVRGVQSLFTSSFVHAAGPLDQTWRARAVRQRLADPHVLPTERARLERLPHD